MYKYLVVFFFLGILGFMISCQQKQTHDTSFYLWKTSVALDSSEYNELQTFGCKTLKIRFFDITWDNDSRKATPNAIARIEDMFLDSFDISPVIFITNETMLQIDSQAVSSLADSAYSLVTKMIENHAIRATEIQIDCDWSLQSKDRYFKFLSRLQEISKYNIVPTLRLHQIKYSKKMGIPPASKVVLMYYNVGTLSPDLNINNSILNETDAKKYMDYIRLYPLTMDVSLPIFSWIILIREGKIENIYSKIGEDHLNVKTDFTMKEPNIFVSNKDQFIEGVYFKKQDVIKLETITPESLRELSEELSRCVDKKKVNNIIFYNFDCLNKNKFTQNDFQEITSFFK